MWIKEDVDDMGLAANSVYLTAWGLAGSFSGLIVPGLLSTLGSRGFTTLTNATNFLACIVWGGIPLGPRMWAIFSGEAPFLRNHLFVLSMMGLAHSPVQLGGRFQFLLGLLDFSRCGPS